MAEKDELFKRLKEIAARDGGSFNEAEIKYDKLMLKYGDPQGALKHGEELFQQVSHWIGKLKRLPRTRYEEDNACLSAYVAVKSFPDEALVAILIAGRYLHAESINMWNFGYYCALKDNNLLKEDKPNGTV